MNLYTLFISSLPIYHEHGVRNSSLLDHLLYMLLLLRVDVLTLYVLYVSTSKKITNYINAPSTCYIPCRAMYSIDEYYFLFMINSDYNYYIILW